MPGGRTADRGWNAGWASGTGWISDPNTWFTHSTTRGDGAEVGVELRAARRRRSRRGPRGTSRCRPAGSGRSTASGRRRRRAGPAPTGSPLHVVRRRLVGGAGDAQGQLDLDAGRCPGTRRAAGGGSAGAGWRARAASGRAAAPVPARGGRGTEPAVAAAVLGGVEGEAGQLGADAAQAGVADLLWRRRAAAVSAAPAARTSATMPAQFSLRPLVQAPSSPLSASSRATSSPSSDSTWSHHCAIAAKRRHILSSSARQRRRRSATARASATSAVRSRGGGSATSGRPVRRRGPSRRRSRRRCPRGGAAGAADVNASSTTRSSAGSEKSRSRKAAQRSSKATCEPISSITSTTGGRPASTGCSRRSRCANEWRVPMAAASRASMARRQRSAMSGPSVVVVGRSLEGDADAVAQLGGGLLGEGDGGDGGEVVAGLDQGHQPLDQRRGLAGAGAGLHEQRGVELIGDASRAGVRRRERRVSHGRLPGGSARAR